MRGEYMGFASVNETQLRRGSVPAMVLNGIYLSELGDLGLICNFK